MFLPFGPDNYQKDIVVQFSRANSLWQNLKGVQTHEFFYSMTNILKGLIYIFFFNIQVLLFNFFQNVKRADQNKASVRFTKFPTPRENWLYRDRSNRLNSVTPQPRFQKRYSCVCRAFLGRAVESAQSNTFLQARGLVLTKANTSNVMTSNLILTPLTCGR